MNSTLRIEARSDAERARQVLSGSLAFGQSIADLMVLIPHTREKGWHDPAIVPYGPLEIPPAAKVFHYSLELFEGHKAYRWPNGDIALFRPEENARRLNRSARGLAMPEIPEELQLEAIETLVDLLRDWVPDVEGSALYLRPTMIGTDPTLGVAPSNRHLYFVLASPVGPYFVNGFAPISILVEEERVRAAVGGVGDVKTGGNYAGGMAVQERAKAAGFDQVLWLDAKEHAFVEELHAMNAFVVQGTTLITPPLDGAILPGITRASILQAATDLGLKPREEPIRIEDLVDGIRSGRVTEMFAAGTAAAITPIGVLGYRGKRWTPGDGEPGPVSRKLYDVLFGTQYGRTPDRYGWMRVVPRRHASAIETAEAQEPR